LPKQTPARCIVLRIRSGCAKKASTCGVSSGCVLLLLRLLLVLATEEAAARSWLLLLIRGGIAKEAAACLLRLLRSRCAAEQSTASAGCRRRCRAAKKIRARLLLGCRTTKETPCRRHTARSCRSCRCRRGSS
jgi:hypothetical protein